MSQVQSLWVTLAALLMTAALVTYTAAILTAITRAAAPARGAMITVWVLVGASVGAAVMSRLAG